MSSWLRYRVSCYCVQGCFPPTLESFVSLTFYLLIVKCGLGSVISPPVGSEALWRDIA